MGRLWRDVLIQLLQFGDIGSQRGLEEARRGEMVVVGGFEAVLLVVAVVVDMVVVQVNMHSYPRRRVLRASVQQSEREPNFVVVGVDTL